MKESWYYSETFKKMDNCVCPGCKNIYPFGPIFDHHARVCPFCNINLVEWNLNDRLILIDVKRAPDLVKDVIRRLDLLTEPEAQAELENLYQMLTNHDKE